MAAPDLRPGGGFAPVSVVWCRQVDNEAESPGYTTIPEDFPARRETLETIRLVGNLTVNVADTHDYWDPDPAQTLSYYPNLFLYPAGNGRYTCVGRMFLSTEDRPRLGMKTLVLDTPQLIASGDFGGAVLQAWDSMGGRPGAGRRRAEPEPSVYQAVGEGFLFHRGTTEPVVIVAADQWESAIDAVRELVRLLPTSLTALGAFLVFPYFLPEGKVNLHEFAEQIPLALAVMRVAEREAAGDRHSKRLQSWEAAPISLRDLTKPVASRAKEALPLVLQYVRDHDDTKIVEVSRRVDLVEADRLRGHLEDSDRQGGKDRRKEMWRIGTAMESAALLLARPRGRSIPMSGEAAKRASQYLQAHPDPDVTAGAVANSRPAPAVAEAVARTLTSQVPPWLQRPPEIRVPSPGPVAVPVSVQDDPSTLPAGAAVPPPLSPPPVAPAPAAPVALAPVAPTLLPPDPGLSPARSAESDARLRSYVADRVREVTARLPTAVDPKAIETRVTAAVLDSESRSNSAMDRRVRELTESQSRALATSHGDLAARLAAVEARPVLPPNSVPDEIARQLRETVSPKLAEQFEKSRLALKASTDSLGVQLRSEIAESIDETKARGAKSEEDLRAALIAQMDIELREAKEQGATLREEIEGRVRELLKERLSESDVRRSREIRELEQRLGLLVDGRTKDLENRVLVGGTEQRENMLQGWQDQLAQTERRLELAHEARVTAASEAQTQALAGLQVRLQSYFDQRMREDQDREREKYVELLARLKTDVDQGLAHTIDSPEFDRAVRERTTRVVESLRLADHKTLEARIADATARNRTQQEAAIDRLAQVEAQLKERASALAAVEQTVRRDLEDLDRRLQVMADRMVPLVRSTWLKVDELQRDGGPSAAADARLKEFRREFSRELRRLEGEMLEQTTELRDRMEGAIAHQGRIWLNFVRQMAASDDDIDAPPTDAAARSLRRATRAAAASARPDARSAPLRPRANFAPFDDDPVNPLDPEAEAPDLESSTDRRRVRRAP
ncbi:MAG: hypothetical protein ACRECT_08255 [Thermoplasmata archaeon]